MKKYIIISILLIILGHSLVAETFKVEKNDDGWVFLKDGEPFPIYGMVWSFTPIGENYTFNLWAHSDDYIKKMIDIDFRMMKDMGVNAIRSFATIPPKWITYIYETYGIYTAINYLFARYGISVNNKWYPNTDYSMPDTRAQIIKETIAMIEDYKDVPGVLMFMLGNENNYGLIWESNEVQNIPEGDRHRYKAQYLYSLLGEAITEAKKHTDLPIAIVNGDVLYIDLIKQYANNVDILATNTYRGKRTYDPDNEYSTPFFEAVEEILDKPVVFSEFGSDAYNTVTRQEDQFHQAEYLMSQWHEIFERSAGKDSTDNALGGFVFEWIDEWWKKGLEENLDIHDTKGSWVNGGYAFDFIPEQWNTHYNMNEEWLGIIAQSERKYSDYYSDIHQRIPRAAYFMLGDVWTRNMYDLNTEEVENHFEKIDLGSAVARALSFSEKPHTKRLGDIVQVSPTIASAMRGHWQEDADNLQFSIGGVASLATTFTPTDNFGARFNVRFQYEALDDVFRDSYSYMLAKGDLKGVESSEYHYPVAFYSSSFLFTSKFVNLEGFFHDGYRLGGHADWVTEGDFFGLLPETFYMPELDRKLSKAPFGIEIATQDTIKGFKLYMGPELFKGSRPSLMAKFYREFNLDGHELRTGVLHEEEFANKIREEDRSDNPLARKSSFQLGYSNKFANFFTLHADLGMLISGMEKIDEKYVSGYRLNNNIPINTTDAVELMDTLAYKAKVTLGFDTNPIFFLWTQYIYAGAVAESRAIKTRTGSALVDNGTGNKHEAIGGLSLYYENLHLQANYLWRTPLIKPVDTVTTAGTRVLRDPVNGPIIVNGNRESLQLELLLTYDMTGATYFYEWNNVDREDALFAGSLGFHYTVYNGETDALKFQDANDIDQSWGRGLERVENLYMVSTRLISQFTPTQKIIVEGQYGTTQNTGQPSVDPQSSYAAKISYAYRQLQITTGFANNMWGQEDWHREFGFTIPWQYSLSFAYHFNKLSILTPTHYIFSLFEFRNFDGATSEEIDALNVLGSNTDMARYALTLGYSIKL